MAAEIDGDVTYRETNHAIGEWFITEMRLRDTIEVTATELAQHLERPVHTVKHVLDDLADDPRVPIERDEHRYRVTV